MQGFSFPSWSHCSCVQLPGALQEAEASVSVVWGWVLWEMPAMDVKTEKLRVGIPHRNRCWARRGNEIDAGRILWRCPSVFLCAHQIFKAGYSVLGDQLRVVSVVLSAALIKCVFATIRICWVWGFFFGFSFFTLNSRAWTSHGSYLDMNLSQATGLESKSPASLPQAQMWLIGKEGRTWTVNTVTFRLLNHREMSTSNCSVLFTGGVFSPRLGWMVRSGNHCRNISVDFGPSKRVVKFLVQ